MARVTSGRRKRSRGLAGIVLLALLGFGFTASVTMVHASGRDVLREFFASLVGAGTSRPAPLAEPEPRAARHDTFLPASRRSGPVRLVQRTPRFGTHQPRTARGHSSARTAAATPAPMAGTRTLCVRLCDGYIFPIGRLHARADLPVHAAACSAACPNAPSELFTLASGRSEMQDAVSLAGQPYRRMARANLDRRERVAACSCQPAGQAGPLMDLGRDRTLRTGDVIASEGGADLVTGLTPGGPVLADYRTAPASRPVRAAIEARIGALERDAVASAFRRSLQASEARSRRVRVAEAEITGPRSGLASVGFADVVSRAGAGFLPVRVVAPSPFGR